MHYCIIYGYKHVHSASLAAITEFSLVQWHQRDTGELDVGQPEPGQHRGRHGGQRQDPGHRHAAQRDHEHGQCFRLGGGGGGGYVCVVCVCDEIMNTVGSSLCVCVCVFMPC